MLSHSKFLHRLRMMREACKEGRFRWDLYYRLSIAELRLPTLAEWTLTEKRALVDSFVKAKQKTLRKEKRIKFTPAALRLLDEYLFPGNIRELENLIESLYVFATDTVDINDLPDWIRQPDTDDSSFDWKNNERQLIERALHYFQGNKSRTCEALGYKSINTLMKKLDEYNLKSA